MKWVAEKNTRELERLDGAVEFISSSRTAAKALMWVCGVAASFAITAFGLAKSRDRSVLGIPGRSRMTLRVFGYFTLTLICGTILSVAGVFAWFAGDRAVPVVVMSSGGADATRPGPATSS